MDLREDLRGPVLGSSLGGLTLNSSGSAPTRRRRSSDIFKCRLLLALHKRAPGCLDLREDLHGHVLGSPLGRLTRIPSGSAPSYGDGRDDRTATFLNVVLLLALSECGSETWICVNICVVLYWALLSEDWPESPPAPPPVMETEETTEQRCF